jgi:hypothetical protein
LDVLRVLGMAQRGVSVERMDRRQPRVPRSSAVATLSLEVIEKAATVSASRSATSSIEGSRSQRCAVYRRSSRIVSR